MKTFIGIMLLLGSMFNFSVMADTMQSSIQDVKQRHETELLALPGVVSVGIGLDDDRQAVIVIGVDRDDAELRSAIPQQLEGYRVRVQQLGTPRAQ